MSCKLKKLLLAFSIAAGCNILVLQTALASPCEALFFPDSVRVWDTGEFTLQDRRGRTAVSLELPAQADPSTLLITPGDRNTVSISEVRWERTDPQDSDRIKELLQKIREHESLKQEQKALIKAHKASISFWESRKEHKEDIEKIDSLAVMIFDNLKQVYQEHAGAKELLLDIREKINELQDRLKEITGPEHRNWEVLVFVADADKRETVEMAFNYILKGSGWSPKYRLHADTGQSIIEFTWEAEVWQSSGQDWKDTRIGLATLEPRIALEPPVLQEWIVRPVPRVGLPGPRDLRMASMEAVPDRAPVREHRGQFSVWHLGEQDLAAGERPRMKIQQESWPADFVRLLRPAISDKAFLQAGVQLDEVQNIPRGEAMFLHGDAMIGQQDFSFTGTDRKIHFGEDPFVTAETTTKASASGTRGIIRERRTYRWHFLINLQNNHDHPARIRLEEPRPILGDDNMQASFDLTPEPGEKTESLFIWEMELDGGDTREIDLQIEIQAPGDMDVDWGWRSR